MRHSLTLAAVLSLAASFSPALHAQQGSTASALRAGVDQAIAQRKLAGFDAAKLSLQQVLERCNTGAFGDDCGGFVSYSLGYLYQTEAADRRGSNDSLYLRAIDYYDQVIAGDPQNLDALYNKALVYRAMGARETQAPYFREAAERDPARRAAYLSLEGDYYAERQLPNEAALAYRDALTADPKDEGARSGLIEVYRTMGAEGLRPLFEQAEQWRDGFAASAAEAYAVLLEEAITAGNRTLADTACIRLVAMQDRVAGPFLTLRPDLPSVRTWAPAQQIDRFMVNPQPDAVPWWKAGMERQDAIARAALLRGLTAANQGDIADAERFLSAGITLARPTSAEAVDLQRELALLYMRNPTIDPNGERFSNLEDRIFGEKSDALVSGDLEAAQRFHTTLGLIYVERGTWTSPRPHRSALDQLSYLLRAADGRLRNEGFYQPLPDIRALLLQGMVAHGRADQARDLALATVRAWLDVDDVAAADSTLAIARRLGADVNQLARLAALTRLRSTLDPESGQNADPSVARPECAATPDLAADATGPADFQRRQRFKILADCASVGPATHYRDAALAALGSADTTGFTLNGAPDVRRFERALGVVMRFARQPDYPGRFRMRIERAAPPGVPSLMLSLRNQTVPRWATVASDDMLMVRVLRVLGPEGARASVDARNGNVTIRGIPLPAATMARLRILPGLASVRAGG